MIRSAHEIIPDLFADELLRLNKLNREWVIVQTVNETHFQARLADGCKSKIKGVWENGSDAIGHLGMSKWLADGPKTFRPTAEQCKAMAEIEVGVTLAEFGTPYENLLIEIPDNVCGPIDSVLMYRHASPLMLSITCLSKNHLDDVGIMARDNDKTLEEFIVKYGEDVSTELGQNCARAARVAINSCLCLVNFGHKKEPVSKAVESDRKLSQEQSERGQRARDRLKVATREIAFAQEVKLHDSRDERKHNGNDTSCIEMPPHWRRGHWRMQRCGPQLSEKKRILIKPCLVRADRFVGELADTSTSYTVK